MEIYLTPKISCPAMSLSFVKMVNQTKHVFYVGERAPDDSRKIALEGFIVSPGRFSKGDILFLQGFSGKYEDYMHLLLPLGEEHRVITYNYRGHSSNKQRFNDKAVLSDIEQVLDTIPREGNILAHSYGANLAARLASDKADRIYCIAPLFNPKMFAGKFRFGINAAKLAGYVPGILKVSDLFLDKTGLSGRLGFNNSAPLQSLRELAKISEKKCSKKMAFALSDNDSLFGTQNPGRYMLLLDKILESYPQAKDRSELVRGLNHCLNLQGLVPFLKQEPGKDSNKIIEDIIDFYNQE